MKDINAVLNSHSDSLMKINGVAGVYVGLKDDSIQCIKVMVEINDPELLGKIPKSLEGFVVETEATGRIEPLRQ